RWASRGRAAPRNRVDRVCRGEACLAATSSEIRPAIAYRDSTATFISSTRTSIRRTFGQSGVHDEKKERHREPSLSPRQNGGSADEQSVEGADPKERAPRVDRCWCPGTGCAHIDPSRSHPRPHAWRC